MERTHRPPEERGQPPPRVTPAGRDAHGVLALQRTAGNRAVAATAQRTELSTKGGGLVADVNGPGTNRRRDVLGVQERLLALWSMTNSDYDSEHSAVAAKGDADLVLAEDIPLTIAGIARNEGSHLGAGPAQGVLKAALRGGVGTGQPNNATDVELVLDLLHEEWHVTNDEYDRGLVVLTGAGATVDPAAVPGLLPGLTKLKRFFVAGHAFRGTTRRRKKPVAPDGPDQAAYEKAIARNLRERRVMEGWLTEAKAQRKDTLLRNSAEWCTTGKIVLFTLTLTHDSPARAKASGHPREMALFSYPGGPLGQPAVPYQRKPKGTAAYDNADVDFQAQGVGGFHTGNHITVVEPSRQGKGTFFDTLKHEAQHDADKSGTSDEELHKSEFRAYWLTGTFDHLSPTKRIRRLGHTWNERQFGIFQHLMSAPVAAYPYARKNWNTNVPGWRAMVVGFSRPQSINPVNSVRIENLREAIEACTTTDCLADDRQVAAGEPRNARALAVRTAIGALDEVDRKAVVPNIALNQLALLHLAGGARDAYFAIR